jgi:hypothetical protein
MTITLTREEAQQVLDALEDAADHIGCPDDDDAIGVARRTIRARLAHPEPEPVAWFTEDYREDKSATTYSKKMAGRWKEKGWPVTPLYTAPPQRKEWQELTDEEIMDLCAAQWASHPIDIGRIIEAKLKEKNT